MDYCQIDDEEYLEIQQQILTPIKNKSGSSRILNDDLFDYLSF